MSPYDSSDLTILIERALDTFIVYRSPDTAEYGPQYREVARYPNVGFARAATDRLIGLTDIELSAEATA
jgi:hypothetical protein